jgi:GTPase
VAVLASQAGGVHGGTGLDALAARVAAGELDPYSAADELAAAASV